MSTLPKLVVTTAVIGDRDGIKASAHELAKQYNTAERRRLVEIAVAPDATAATRGCVLVFTGDARIRPVLRAGVRLGDGVTWMRVTSDPLPTQAAVDAMLAKLDGLDAIAENTTVRLQTGRDELGDVQYVVALGGDDGALAAFAAAVDEHAVFDDLAPGGRLASAYETLVAAAAARRQADALAFASRLSLVVESATATMRTSSVAPATAYAATYGAADTRYWRVYAAAVDPETATDGVFLDTGPFAGGVVYEGEHAVDARRTKAFVNAVFDGPDAGRRAYSIFPATSGVLDAASSRTAALHADASERARAAFAARVKWSGPVRAFNDAATLRYAAAHDAALDAALVQLKKPLKPPLVLSVMATYMPGIQTRALGFAALAALVERIRTAEGADGPTTTLPVAARTVLLAAATSDAVAAATRLDELVSAETRGAAEYAVPLDVIDAVAKALAA